MGMYDHIECDYPLPEGAPKGPFQTKDLICQLRRHKITSAGRLLEEQGCDEEVPKAERPFPNAKNSLEELCGSWRWVSTGWKDLNYHGMLLFYEYVTETEQFYEYHAKFTDGMVVEISGGERVQ